MAENDSAPTETQDFPYTVKEKPPAPTPTAARGGRQPIEFGLDALTRNLLPQFEVTQSRAEAAGEESRAATTLAKQAEADVAAKKAAFETGVREQREPELQDILKQRGEPFKPTKDSLPDIIALFGITAAMGALAGKGPGGNSGLAAMNAMTGMMNGYRQGRADLVENERKNFEIAQKQLDRRLESYKIGLESALAKAPKDLLAAMQEAQQLAVAAGDKALAADLANRGVAAIVEKINAFEKVLGKRDELNVKLYEGAQNRAMEQQRINVEKMKLARPAIGPYALIESVYGEGSARGLKDKQVSDINQAITGLAAVKHVGDLARDPDIKFGKPGAWAVQAQQQIDAALQSAGIDTAKDIPPEKLDQAINTMQSVVANSPVDPNDKNAIFQKEAAFAALEIERSVRGGSFLPIGFVKTIGPLLDPRYYTRDAYLGVLKTRENELYQKLSQNRIDKRGADTMVDYMKRGAGLSAPSYSTPVASGGVIKLD